MSLPAYTIVTRSQGNNRALTSGEVVPRTARLAFVEVDPLIAAFRRMVRGLAYDVCEMAIATYLVAREYGTRFTALPVFLQRGFHHGAIVVADGSAIRTPKDLEGRRVGVNRGYTVTTGVWARGILASEYGVALDAVTWVRSGDEHVEHFRRPSNVVSMPEGTTLDAMLRAGEIAAAIGIAAGPGLRPLIADPDAAARRALAERAFYPIDHLIVVKDDVLAAQPELAADLFDAFAESKRRYVERVRAPSTGAANATDAFYRRVAEITGADPLPYGIEPNRHVLEALIGHALEQRIITRRPSLSELFADTTRELVA